MAMSRGKNCRAYRIRNIFVRLSGIETLLILKIFINQNIIITLVNSSLCNTGSASFIPLTVAYVAVLLSFISTCGP